MKIDRDAPIGVFDSGVGGRYCCKGNHASASE